MKTLLAVVAVALVSGCIRSGFARLPGRMANSPANEAPATGEYWYSHSGGTKARVYERALAYEKMAGVCEGEYRIDNESLSDDVRVISFTCTRDGGEWAPSMIDAGVVW